MNGKIKKTFIKASILFLLLISVSSGQTVKFKFIETTDTHGAIFPYDFTNMKPNNHSLAQIYTYVEQQRADTTQAVILLSNGDILQGTPAVYYYNFEKTDEPHLYAQVMNYMKYDAGSVGNHDIETGHPVYDKFVKELDFPWLSANSVDVKTGKPYFKPYTVIERRGIKIAILGLITPAIPNWLPQKIWAGMRFDDMIETAKKWVPIIKEKEKPDIMIGLFHSGVNPNYNGQTAETYKNENATKLVAEQVPGFDIVFAGHDHHGWNMHVKNPAGKEILLIGGTSSARVFAEVSAVLTYDKAQSSWNKEITGKLVESKDYEPDPGFLKKFNPQFEEVKKYVSKEIGVFSKTISSRDALFGDSPFVDLIHTIQLDISKAEISLASPLTFNTEIKKGKIYVKDMFKLYRYENLLYTMSLSGKEIKEILEYSAGKWFNQMKNANDDLLKFKKDKNGKLVWSERSNSPMLEGRFYNFESAEGINYTVDVSKPVGERIKISSMSDGSNFILTKMYKVALNSYRGNGGGGHLTIGAKISKDKLASRIITSTEKDLRFYMMKWIEKKGTINPKTNNNWKIIPKEWAEKGKEKDYKLLFGK
ncbi:5'-nucleotidase; 2',3'-cyclic-nucleotide 2'-phosphodiesterase; Putative UDP-sugar hydrolase [hydrothermal vent metagenome]|uniref:5'-nucleotidase 2',3'-cyclic-nucleotide 2'-phosphodiesterase Putative UDP-sugar hydrolase n=1 Tax=hydrothermal vent metagenome TaxID=652676 RepID=A0A3B1CPU6_9ZZZZ